MKFIDGVFHETGDEVWRDSRRLLADPNCCTTGLHDGESVAQGRGPDWSWVIDDGGAHAVVELLDLGSISTEASRRGWRGLSNEGTAPGHERDLVAMATRHAADAGMLQSRWPICGGPATRLTMASRFGLGDPGRSPGRRRCSRAHALLGYRACRLEHTIAMSRSLGLRWSPAGRRCGFRRCSPTRLRPAIIDSSVDLPQPEGRRGSGTRPPRSDVTPQ